MEPKEKTAEVIVQLLFQNFNVHYTTKQFEHATKIVQPQIDDYAAQETVQLRKENEMLKATIEHLKEASQPPQPELKP